MKKDNDNYAFVEKNDRENIITEEVEILTKKAVTKLYGEYLKTGLNIDRRHDPKYMEMDMPDVSDSFIEKLRHVFEERKRNLLRGKEFFSFFSRY